MLCLAESMETNMIQFTFTHTQLGPWSTAITLTKGMTGGEAFEVAVAQYRSMAFPQWVPGHPDVTIEIRGV